MNPGSYFIPGASMMMPNSFLAPTRGLGLFRNIGRGAGILKGINWGNLFSNTSRALGVVNQAIPIVKQAGPMFNNMRSMLKVASAFKDVTDSDKQKKNTSKTSNKNNYNNTNNYNLKYNNNYVPNTSYNMNRDYNFQYDNFNNLNYNNLNYSNSSYNYNNPNFFI